VLRDQGEKKDKGQGVLPLKKHPGGCLTAGKNLVLRRGVPGYPYREGAKIPHGRHTGRALGTGEQPEKEQEGRRVRLETVPRKMVLLERAPGTQDPGGGSKRLVRCLRSGHIPDWKGGGGKIGRPPKKIGFKKTTLCQVGIYRGFKGEANSLAGEG